MPATVKIFLWIILLAVMAVLSKKILFKNRENTHLHALQSACTKKNIQRRLASANLKPFATIKLFYNSRRLNPEYKMINLAGNIAGFIPLGLLLPLLMPWLRKGSHTIAAVFLISLGFETTQLLFNLGVFDVDDLILNTAGGIIGYIIYFVIRTIAMPGKALSENTG